MERRSEWDVGLTIDFKHEFNENGIMLLRVFSRPYVDGSVMMMNDRDW